MRRSSIYLFICSTRWGSGLHLTLFPFNMYSFLFQASLGGVLEGDESNMLKLQKKSYVLHKNGRFLRVQGVI